MVLQAQPAAAGDLENLAGIFGCVGPPQLAAPGLCFALRRGRGSHARDFNRNQFSCWQCSNAGSTVIAHASLRLNRDGSYLCLLPQAASVIDTGREPGWPRGTILAVHSEPADKRSHDNNAADSRADDAASPASSSDDAPAPAAHQAGASTDNDQLLALQASYTRALADCANLRRESTESRAAGVWAGMATAVSALLPIRDSLSRAVAAADADGSDVGRGLSACLRQYDEALTSLGVAVVVPASGSPADPAQHEIVSTAEGSKPGCVVAVLEPGYRLGDQLLRPARISVGA